MQKISPFLWFNDQAEQAVNFYTSVFKNSAVHNISRYGEGAPVPAGTVMSATFEIEGQNFTALNGGPGFSMNPSISMFVVFGNENDIKEVWDKLIVGGNALMPFGPYPWAKQYGWLQDKYGLSWQLSFSEHHSQFPQKLTPSLMFTGDQAGRAAEAMQFYSSLFPDSKIDIALHYEEGDGDKAEYIKHARFTLNGQSFLAMDSSLPHAFSFNEAISLFVLCDNQEEVDRYWDYLSSDGAEGQCGWLKDKFGLSWQIVPKSLQEMLSDSDPEKANRAMAAMLQMKKIDIEILRKAHDGE